MLPAAQLPGRHRPAHLPRLALGNRSVLVFLTACTKDRRRLLANPDAFSVLLDAWRAADAWAVGRYVVMPDHVHLFCAPVDPAFALGQWIAYGKRTVTRELHKRGLVEGEVWQREHWDTQLCQGDSYHAKWAYVCENPVRAGLVVRAAEWPYQGELQTLLWHEPR